ncbi:uncharacterized protein K02A2.6-like [Coccinella septempunctata]|uniref:uncharacterized protein K02A2.6-like n=1 Tax=Coccinella septempunctata TaxID=41139 RepID=UPI001D08D351|nr:uncharacterized protein K02A2.6-like [Coccinella septempunctata]
MINGGPPIAGRDLLEMYNLKFSDVNFVRVEHRNLDELLTKYKNLFEPGLGKFTKGTASIKLKDNVTPHFIKYRPVPYAIKEKVEIELNRLLSLGVIEPVDFSDWATPVVPVLKKGGQEVRLCGDYKVTINPCIEVDKYPLPRIENLLGALGGGKKFSKLDLSQAYQQICVDDESKELLTISTHKGLFRYNRLTYGVASAPAKFQKIMESLLSGIEGVEIFLDDILVTGPNDEKHLSRLEKVLRILSEAGFRLYIEKCEFFKEQIEYLGYVIDAEGLHACQSKTIAIQNIVRPKNVSELKSALGLINYYGKFVNNLATIIAPLYSLLQKNTKWVWSEHCERAFEEIKRLVQSPEVLVPFNPELPLKLTVDASSVGIGAILSHEFPSGIEKPIAYASRSLSV